MSSAELRELFEQRTRALERHPSLGKASVQASVKLVSTYACETRRGAHVTRTDLPPDEGGSDTGPTPGDLMRASLGACMAMGYRTWAAQLGVELGSVEVDVSCEYDARGQLGLADDVSIGWERLLFEVRIVTSGPPSEVRRVVEVANRLSPMLANLSPDITQIFSLTVSRLEHRSPTTLMKDSP